MPMFLDSQSKLCVVLNTSRLDEEIPKKYQCSVEDLDAKVALDVPTIRW